MGATGHDWGAWAFVQESASNWDADLLADNGTDTSDAITVDVKSSITIGMAFYENNTGAIDGVVTIFILGDAGGIAYEETLIGNAQKFQITPVQNDTVYTEFTIDPRDHNNFKIAVLNESGQELAVSCKYKTADIPVAS